MARRSVSYRIVLRNKRGGFSKPRYAHTYEIYYGKRRIVSRREFPSSRKTVASKKDFLGNLVSSIESKRLKVLEKKRRERAREFKRLADRRHLEEFKAREQRRIEEAAGEVPAIAAKVSIPYIEEVVAGTLDFNKARSEPPVVLKAASISDTIIIPVKPDGSTFVREQIVKTITETEMTDIVDVAIMNVNLTESEFVEVNNENFDLAYVEVYEKLYPILLDYWLQTKDSSDSYILRLKFIYDFDRGNNWSDHGISIGIARQAIHNRERLMDIFRATFTRLLGSEVTELVVNGKRKRRGARDYLKDDASIFISGATLESRSHR